MKKTKFDVIEFVKTTVIFILTFSMLTTAGIYMNERQNSGASSEVPLEKRRILENGGIKLSAIQINPNYINPLQIIITSDTKSIAAVYNSKVISDIYKEFTDFVLALFVNTAVCEKIGNENDDNDEQSEAAELWTRALNSPDSVYVKYAGDYVYPIIYDFLVQTEVNEVEESYIYGENKVMAKVRELFILPADISDSSSSDFIGIAKDSDGNVSVFYPGMFKSELEYGRLRGSSAHASFISVNSENFAAYNNTTGIVPCRFLKDGAIQDAAGFNKNNIQNLTLPEDFILFDAHTYSAVLSYLNPIFDEYNQIDIRKGEKIGNLLKIFNFNIERSGLHFAEENGKIGKKFIEDHGSLTVFEDGRIFYNHTSSDTGTAENNIVIPAININGIHLSNFLGYDSDYYTFNEKIRASGILINSLSAEIADNDGELYLSEVKFEQERLTITFSYYYQGIKIKANNQDIGVSVVISNNTMTEADINIVYITTEKTTRNLKQVTALSYFEAELKKSKDTGSISEEAQDIAEVEEREETAANENVEAVPEIMEITETEEIPEIEGTEGTEETEEVKFAVKNLELVYNINTAAENNEHAASWVIH